METVRDLALPGAGRTICRCVVALGCGSTTVATFRALGGTVRSNGAWARLVVSRGAAVLMDQATEHVDPVPPPTIRRTV
jgi:hypothetical protein